RHVSNDARDSEHYEWRLSDGYSSVRPAGWTNGRRATVHVNHNRNLCVSASAAHSYDEQLPRANLPVWYVQQRGHGNPPGPCVYLQRPCAREWQSVSER